MLAAPPLHFSSVKQGNLSRSWPSPQCSDYYRGWDSRARDVVVKIEHDADQMVLAYLAMQMTRRLFGGVRAHFCAVQGMWMKLVTWTSF